ncbi:MAG: ATP-binding protein [Candidatus Competibacteraceae bacterium]
MPDSERLIETVTLSQAKAAIGCLAHEQSILLLSPPGVGKSDSVMQAARDAKLECRSLLGTQIAPEDVSGVPRIVGERSVFCPPRVLLPENPQPFCLFLDELPAAAPDIQKAFYSLLLERRVGEHRLPAGTWVVAAGNRAEDRALVRTLSSALINRVIVLNVRVDVREWLVWAKANGLRSEVLSFIAFMPRALMRDVPREPVPFSTPRAWASLSRALDLSEKSGILNRELRRALSFGSVSPEDAAVFCAIAEERIGELQPLLHYIERPEELPSSDMALWFLLNRIRAAATDGDLDGIAPAKINAFLNHLPEEHRFALLVDRVSLWGRLGADEAMFNALKQVSGLDA